ncbi:unnamed protein product [Vicia faba]|uniref:Uncharacterized protein n=1 Tax=Vicia faba TaxID=3906 RepID=A0AAV1AAP8_VICFA|nr:unnamed protein product [Vicia faba]
MEIIERSLCTWWWGTTECDFHFKPSDGRSGDIITIWDNKELCVKERIVKDHYIWLKGEWVRSKVITDTNINFKQISEQERKELVEEFSEEEIRKAVWDCDNSKIRDPDDVNFGFLKELWCDVKADFKRVLEKFHKHGRIVRGENSSFIVLIPKKKNPTKLENF